MRERLRPFILIICLLGLLVPALPGLAAELRIERGDQGLALRVDDEAPFHATRAEVMGARLLELSGGATRVATWTEKSATGTLTPFYALGLRGQEMGPARATTYRLKLHHGEFEPLTESAPRIEAALTAPRESRLHLVQFVTQPLRDYREALTALGARIVGFMPHHAYIVEMGAEQREAVEALDFVRWVGPHHPAYRVEEILRTDLETLERRFPEQRYSILLFDSRLSVKQELAARIEALGGRSDQVNAGRFLTVATLSAQQLLQVARWDEVAYIDRWSPLETDMDLVRQQGGADELESVAGYTGAGVRGESFDSGFNINHPDFASRPPIEHGGPVGVASHGTACLGVCFGDGTGDAQARGLLPDGQPIAADYNNVGLTGNDRYTHTGELREAPYFAVFQTASVGSSRTAEYTTISADHDTLLFDWDVLHCQSQSNAGNQQSRPQAWAKNVVSGGAFNHYNTPDTSDDCWCNTGSIGPASDGRIKPDLSFYYDDTYTTYTTGDGYGQFGGTSGATPSICGHFGLFFQMWADGIFGNEVDPLGTVFDNRPHMTTAKAFMINTAIPYPFSGQGADMTRVHQGWGVPNVKNLYDLREKVSFIDESVILQNGEIADFNAFVDAGEAAFKVTMTYADPAGSPASTIHRVNDVTLKVTSPSGTVYWGNNGLLDGNWSVPGGSENTVDTVENVFVENPEGGLWLVEVIATEVVQDGHVETPEIDVDFALVTSGGTISACTSEGAISMNRNAYACEDEVRVRVTDCDLNLDDATIDTVTVTVESDSEPGGESLLLTETDATSGTFINTIPVSTSDAPGTLLINNGDTIVSTYLDEDDGLGGTNLTRTDEAEADCSAPIISAVRDENVTLSSATVLWTTDERSDTQLFWGETIPPTNEKSSSLRVTEHSVDLSGLAECTIYYYEVASTDPLGNAASDDNAGQYYYFETLGDFGSGPVSCHRGDVIVERDIYSCSDLVTIRLSDLDVNVDPESVQTLTVELTSSSEIVPELVTLTETGPNTSTFEGSISTAAGTPVNDGALQIAEGDIITATYHDADDGTGVPALSFDTAIADCAGPGFADIDVVSVTDQRATITWQTDVVARSVLEWGDTPALGQSVNFDDLRTNRSFTINRSAECGPLYFRITATDEYGDVTVADRLGDPWHFHTGTIPGVYFHDDFESGSGGWQLDGEWEIGEAQGQGGSTGRPDPEDAYNNDGVLGHDLSGQGAFPGDYEPSANESAFSPTFDASTWTDTKLILYRNLHTGPGDDAQIRIWVGGPGYTLWRSAEELVSDSGFNYVSYDLAGYVDGNPSVRFQFLQLADASGQYSGWTIDDFILKQGSLPDYGACETCAGVPSFAGATSAFDNDACGAGGVTVSWDEPLSWGTGSGGSFVIYRGESADFEPSPSNLVASGVVGQSFVDSGAPNDRELWYVVRAESNETCASGPANGGAMDTNLVRVQASETTSRPDPDAILALDTTLLGDAHVRLSWPAAGGASAYRVYRSTQPDGSDRVLLSEQEAQVYEDRDSGANKVTYFYEVVAINACGIEGD